MRFALKTPPHHTSWDDLLALWLAADDIDVFESAWLFDHFYPVAGDPVGPCLEAWVTLSALAQATRRLRLGTLVTANVYRHPAVLAKMAATLDVVSGGRLELGLGAGWNERECDAYGIHLGPVAERFDRLEEALCVLLGLFENETTTFDGRHYQLRDARGDPRPLQRPHPPIGIGGAGERRTLRAVARYADHWNLLVESAHLADPTRMARSHHTEMRPCRVEDYPAKLEVLAAHCRDAGRP
ncbi:MAG TPA: LLM class F420-dependent oxidoreductase, partial [Acidimicrobiales bacterium]|nr:LLM class F420-dependent oxidoreductase [Acidimicrobiales bacterium]